LQEAWHAQEGLERQVWGAPDVDVFTDLHTQLQEGVRAVQAFRAAVQQGDFRPALARLLVWESEQSRPARLPPNPGSRCRTGWTTPRPSSGGFKRQIQSKQPSRGGTVLEWSSEGAGAEHHGDLNTSRKLVDPSGEVKGPPRASFDVQRVGPTEHRVPQSLGFATAARFTIRVVRVTCASWPGAE